MPVLVWDLDHVVFHFLIFMFCHLPEFCFIVNVGSAVGMFVPRLSSGLGMLPGGSCGLPFNSK